jgi:uncharacterized membrane protein YwaF
MLIVFQKNNIKKRVTFEVLDSWCHVKVVLAVKNNVKIGHTCCQVLCYMLFLENSHPTHYCQEDLIVKYGIVYLL